MRTWSPLRLGVDRLKKALEIGLARFVATARLRRLCPSVNKRDDVRYGHGALNQTSRLGWGHSQRLMVPVASAVGFSFGRHQDKKKPRDAAGPSADFFSSLEV
jgi:hypothetical protein